MKSHPFSLKYNITHFYPNWLQHQTSIVTERREHPGRFLKQRSKEKERENKALIIIGCHKTQRGYRTITDDT